MLIAGVLAPARTWVGPANVALVLCLVVVLAALTSRLAGIGTAVVAALSFNFVHTKPYGSLRIDDGRDMLTVGLLLFVGIVVSWIGEWRRSAARHANVHRAGEHSLEAVIDVIATGGSADRVLDAVCSALTHDLQLADCRFEPASVSSTSSMAPTVQPTLQRIDRSGGLALHHLRLGAHGFELPDEGAAIEVASGGRTYGQIVLIPRHGSSSHVEQRRVAVALVDLYALAVDREHSSPVA